MTDLEANKTRDGILGIARENPDKMMSEIRKIVMPRHHEVMAKDVNMKRLGAVLTLAHERDVNQFESLLLLEGLGPRTLQSLTLVSEVIYGTPSRFTDPARFSFAHGGKDGHPFPVPTKIYDETIQTLRNSVEKAKMGVSDKQGAIRQLSVMAQRIEESFTPGPFFDAVVQKERDDSYKYVGKTVFGDATPPKQKKDKNGQLKLF